MATRPRVKVCGITSTADARLALDAGADVLGVIAYPKSPRYPGEDGLRGLAGFIPAGRRVVVDVEPSAERLEALGDLGFDAFQVHLGTGLSWAEPATWSGIVGPEALWIAPRLAPGEPFPDALLGFAHTVLLDTFDKDSHGGTGRTGDWEGFRKWSTRYADHRWVLAGGLGPDNVAAALAATGAGFIDVNSGVESSPGRKDPAKLAALFGILAGSLG